MPNPKRPTKNGKGSLILRELQKGSLPAGQITAALIDHDAKTRHRLRETGRGYCGRECEGVVFWVEAGLPAET